MNAGQWSMVGGDRRQADNRIKRRINQFMREHQLKEFNLNEGWDRIAERLEELCNVRRSRSIKSKRRAVLALGVLHKQFLAQ